MNEAQIIKAALERRFARAAIPDCPRGSWSAKTAPAVRPRAPSRGFVYASAVLGILVVAGVAVQASDALRTNFEHLMLMGSGSSKPLPTLIHRADRLTIAQAQRHMPFAIIVPAGLPAHTSLQYAHVVSEHRVPRVALNYQAEIGGRYYRININETTAVSGPPVARFEAFLMAKDGGTRHEVQTVPMRRWKHRAVVMEMVTNGLPATVTDRIVRENTL